MIVVPSLLTSSSAISGRCYFDGRREDCTIIGWFRLLEDSNVRPLKQHAIAKPLKIYWPSKGNKYTWNSFQQFLGRLFYNRAKVYMHQNFLKVVLHVIIIDQWNQTARLYEIQVMVIYSRAILAAVTSEGSVKRTIFPAFSQRPMTHQCCQYFDLNDDN